MEGPGTGWQAAFRDNLTSLLVNQRIYSQGRLREYQ